MIDSIFFAPCAWYGNYHIGAWKALSELGCLNDIKYLGGASSGSLFAFILSAGLEAEYLEDIFDGYARDYPGFSSWGKMSTIVGDSIPMYIKKDAEWKYEPYAVVTTLEKEWPFVGPRIVSIEDKKNIKEIKDVILSSCYIPGIYQKIPKWRGKFVLDGGLFVMKLELPNTLNISPYSKMSEKTIGFEEGTYEESILGMTSNALKSLCPDKDHLDNVKKCGYNLAYKWFEKYKGKK